MSECGEGCASQDINEEEKKKKTPVKIRIALFYDGTLNNRLNIEEREKAELGMESHAEEEFRNDPQNSYDNGRTNVAIMEPHIKEKADGYDYCVKTYIEGQGTINYQKDTRTGYAFGAGVSGVVQRADEGLSRAIGLINGIQDINPTEHYIEKLTIDVFGFSRGAATARYAIHVLFEGRIIDIDDDTGDISFEYNPMHLRLNSRGYDISPKAVEVCFAGLYDTVLSYIGSQYFPFTSNVLQQKAVSRAKKTLHLAAADEHRRDFPLHNIKSAKSKGGEEYYLPGVHSDVGGSYNMANDISIDKGTEGYMRTTTEDLVILESLNRKSLEKDMSYLIEQGWYKKNEIDIEERRVRKTRLGGKVPYYTYRYQLKVTRENIHSSYCNIPLKIMADYATKPEVNLKISSKLKRRANIILKPESDLLELEQKILTYMASTSNSKAEDWIDDNAKLNNQFLKDIRNKHFHFSAKPGLGYAPRIVKNKKYGEKRRTRHIYEA